MGQPYHQLLTSRVPFISILELICIFIRSFRHRALPTILSYDLGVLAFWDNISLFFFHSFPWDLSV